MPAKVRNTAVVGLKGAVVDVEADFVIPLIRPRQERCRVAACRRYHYIGRIRFCPNAGSSLYDVKSHVLTARDVGYLRQSQAVCDILALIDNPSVKLNNIIATTQKLKSKESQ